MGTEEAPDFLGGSAFVQRKAKNRDDMRSKKAAPRQRAHIPKGVDLHRNSEKASATSITAAAAEAEALALAASLTCITRCTRRCTLTAGAPPESLVRVEAPRIERGGKAAKFFPTEKTFREKIERDAVRAQIGHDAHQLLGPWLRRHAKLRLARQTRSSPSSKVS